MKNRIIALILVVVMSVLALSACGSYNLAEEDLSSYASFAEGKNLAAFREALKKLEIKDGTFTTDEAIREALVKSDIYKAIVNKIIAATKEEDRVTEFTEALGDGDILYFVYYATTPDKDGKDQILFGAEFDPSKVTNTSSVIPHVLMKDAYLDEDTNADSFLIKLIEAIKNMVLDPVVTKTAAQLKDEATEKFNSLENKANRTEIENKAKEDLKKKHQDENKPEPTEAELNKAAEDALSAALILEQDAAIKVAANQKLVISYTRTHQVTKLDANGNPVKDNAGNEVKDVITETVKFEEITVDEANALHKLFLEEGATANIGADFTAVTEKNAEGKPSKTGKEFKVTIDGTEYTYTALKFDWLVEKSGTPIVIKHTPYELEDFAKKNETTGEWEREKNEDGSFKTKKEETVTGLNGNGTKIDLVGVELTYHVFPVYAIEANSYAEMAADNAYDLLFHMFGSSLTADSFDVLDEAENYKWTDPEDATKTETVKALLEEITKIFVKIDSVKKDDLKDNTYYLVKDENGALKNTELMDLLEAYQTASKNAGTATSGTKYDAKVDAKDALTEAQNKILKPIIEKIADAKKGEDTLGQKVLEEHYDNQYDSKKSAYESDIQKKINQAVWDVIDEFVKVDTTKLPEKLIKELSEQLYEWHKYEFYMGPTNSNSSTTAKHYDTYKGDFTKYMAEKSGLGLKAGYTQAQLTEALNKKATTEIVPLIKIFFISRELNNDGAVATLQQYVQDDIKGGAYLLTEEDIENIKNYYPNADEVIKERIERAKENEKDAVEEAKYFVIDNKFMDMYRKEVGNVQYNNNIDTYGEINLRGMFQVSKLFYYLTSPVYVEADVNNFVKPEIKYTAADAEGNIYLDFKTVEYTIVED